MAAWQPGATSEHTRGTRFEHTCVAAAIVRSLDLLKIISTWPKTVQRDVGQTILQETNLGYTRFLEILSVTFYLYVLLKNRL